MAILAVAALFLTASCRKKTRPAPDYDSRQRTRQLISACEAIRNGQTTRALDTLQNMRTQYPDDRFPAIAYRQEQKRLLLEEANRLLAETSLNQLQDLIRNSERQGITSPEILAFTQVKDALDQLRLFVSRMPWTTSEALRDSLEQLRRHREILDQSPAFQQFFQAQLKTLDILQATEKRQAVINATQALDLAFIAGTPERQTNALLRTLNSRYPENFLARALNPNTAVASLTQAAQITPEARHATEIAVARRFPTLSPQDRTAALQFLASAPPQTLSGAWLALQNRLQPNAANHFLDLLAHHPSCLPSQAVVREFMEKNLLSQTHYNAWCWRSPCPGATELITRIKQVGQAHSLPQKH